MSKLDDDIIEYILQYGLREGYLPTMREIAKEFNIGLTTVFYHFSTLEERGFIIRVGQRYCVKGLKYVRE